MAGTRPFLVVVEVVGENRDLLALLRAIADADLPSAEETTSWAIPDELEAQVRRVLEAL
ncbi:MAG: hypothetical protein QOI63_983 [Thermoplasmata archaeon]|jgi:hypothetical protein|nr:hypothetical protein [Thermoplasmata archaeon]